MPSLINTCCIDFDKAYMESMYQHHTNISALATLGIQNSTNKDIRDLSGKIRYEQTKMNEKLAMWYREAGYGSIPVGLQRPNCDLEYLSSLTGPAFDVEYVQTMMNYLEQSYQAAELAKSRSCMPGLRDQAEITARSAELETAALQRWLDKRFVPS